MPPKNSDNSFSLWITPAWIFFRLPKIWAFCTLNIGQGSPTFSMRCSRMSPKSATSQPWAVQRPGHCGSCHHGLHSPPSSSAFGLFFGATALCERLAMCNGPRWRACTTFIPSPRADYAASQTRAVPTSVTVKGPPTPDLVKLTEKIIAVQLGKSGCNGLVLMQQSFMILR